MQTIGKKKKSQEKRTLAEINNTVTWGTKHLSQTT